MTSTTPVLTVENLAVQFRTGREIVRAVNGASFSVHRGEMTAVLGESGSGKSVTATAIMRLLQSPPALVSGGEIRFEGTNILDLPEQRWRKMLGSRIGMVLQDALTALNPVYPVGKQISEVFRVHGERDRRVAYDKTIAPMERVGIPDPLARAQDYPHQFSGGMRQRVMIAMALVLNPPLVIADEPTTALDVTVQAQIVALLDEMRRELGTTVVMITHDLGLLSKVADHVMVLYAGRRMELGPSAPLFAAPANPYTSGLLASSPANYESGAELVPIPGRPPSLLETPRGCVFAPRCASAMPRCATEAPPVRVFSDGLQSLCWLETPPVGAIVAPSPPSPARTSAETVVKAEGVRLSYGVGGLFGRGTGVEVLKGIDLELHRGETLGLVGESGCGKSTFARVLAGLIPMTHGSVSLLGRDLATLDGRAWQAMRREVQLVFQNPFGALNPRRRVGANNGDPYSKHGLASGANRKREVQRLMELVGLNPEHYNRFPSEFSGGQRQRIGIARALALNPSLIIYDEPVSALDVSIQAQVLNLMRSLQRELGLTYLFISHDLAVVRHVCDHIAVMDKGKIVELADAETLYTAPQHPYTQTLLAASVTTPPRHPATGRTLLSSLVPEAA